MSALIRETCDPRLWTSWKTFLIIALLGLAGVGAGVASRFVLLIPAAPPAVPPSSVNEGNPPSPHAVRNPDALPDGAVARLGWSPLRIGNAAFALTPDGRTIVTVTPQGLVRRFDANTGQLLESRLLVERNDVDPVGQSYAHLSADGQAVAVNEPYDGNRRLTVWDIPSGKQIFQRGSSMKSRIGFGGLSPNGKLVALIEDDEKDGNKKRLRIAHLDCGRIRDIGSLEFNVYNVSFSCDGTRIVASQTPSTPGGVSSLVCFDTTAEKELWRVPRKGINFALSPDGKTVISVMLDQRQFQVLETDVVTGKPTERYISCNDVHPNSTILIAPDNRTVVRNHFDEIILSDLRTGKEIRRFALPPMVGRGFGPDLGAFSPDSRTLITNLGHLQRWDLTTGKPFFAAPSDDGLGSPIKYLAYAPDGKELLASAWWPITARWDVMTKKRIAFVRKTYGPQLIRTPDGLRSLQVDSYKSPYEITLIDALADKPLSTIRWTDPKEVTINGLRAFTLTANGKTLLFAHGKELGEKPQTTYVTACDVASNRRLARFSVSGSFYFERSPFSPCGRWVVIGKKVYHVGSGAELFAPAGEPDERLAAWDRETRGSVWFSEDGRLMAGLLRKNGEKSAANDTLAVWEMATGAMLARYPKAGFIAQATFAPDGHALALLDGRGIRLVELTTGKRLAQFAAPDVTCELTDRGCTTQTLVFSPDGSTLATGHLDGTIRLWKVPRHRDTGSAALAEGEAEKLWRDLGSSSPARARVAVDRLAWHPGVAATLLATRFRPPPADAQLATLINDLDGDVFASREEAARKLRVYGARAEIALRGSLAKVRSLEMRRRLESLLAEMSPPALRLPLSDERLRGVRAIEVLERVGGAPARRLLRGWAEQTDDVHLAIEARMALERLAMLMK